MSQCINKVGILVLMTTKDILEQRLWNEQLTQARFGSPAELVSWFGAVQAQDFPSAKWVIGQRLQNATDAAIEEAFNEGKILRTHVMRPTWHFVHPDDIRWMLGLTAPQVKRLMTYYNRILNLDEALFKKTQAIFIKALEGKKQLTRTALAESLAHHGLPIKGQALGHIVMWAELDGVICSGSRIGKQLTYMLLEERVPKTKELSRDESLALLTKKYFQSHGPATMKDFAWWSGLTSADVKRGIELNTLTLHSDQVEEKKYYFFPVLPKPTKGDLYLLPNYDEYTIAFKERELFFDPEKSKKLPPVGRAVAFSHTMVKDGRIIGMYRREVAKNTIVITPKFFNTPTKEETEGLEKAGEKYEKFLDLKIVLS